MLGAVLIPILIGLTAGVTVFAVKRAQAKARAKAMEVLAGQLDLSYSAEDTFGLINQLKDFELFDRERRWIGRRGRIRNVLRGTVGETEVFLFDYTYVISTGKSSRRITQTVFFANDKSWYLPNFSLKPENWSRKLMTLFAKSDINFSDNPVFSSRFWLTGEFESLIRKTFSREVQQFLTDRPPSHVEGRNYYLLAYKPRKILNPDEAEAFFSHCCQLVKLMKAEEKMELLQLAELPLSAEKKMELPPLPLKEERGTHD